MIIPVSYGCAAVRGLTPTDGYVAVEIDTDHLTSQLALLIAQNVMDTRVDFVQILSRQNMFQAIRENNKDLLGKISDIEEYADKMEDILNGLDRLIQSQSKVTLYSHDCRNYQWRVWDNPTISPELWLLEECQAMRKAGLVLSINNDPVPSGLMNSMGSKLVGVAKKQGLLA